MPLREVFKAWVVFIIMSNLLGFLAGAAAGFFISFLLVVAGCNADQVFAGSLIVGFVVGLPVSFLVFSRVVYRWIVPNVRSEHVS